MALAIWGWCSHSQWRFQPFINPWSIYLMCVSWKYWELICLWRCTSIFYVRFLKNSEFQIVYYPIKFNPKNVVEGRYKSSNVYWMNVIFIVSYFIIILSWCWYLCCISVLKIYECSLNCVDVGVFLRWSDSIFLIRLGSFVGVLKIYMRWSWKYYLF